MYSFASSSTVSSSDVSCVVEPATEIQYERKEGPKVLGREVRKHWEISDHCSLGTFPAAYPDISWPTRSCHYYYLLYTAEGVPDSELRRDVRQAHYRVLAGLQHSELQVKNFILPVQLMKLKYIDPYSRQRVVEELCRFLSSQNYLRSVVLEQAEVTFPDLCRLLLAVSYKSHLTKLYLWGVLDKCNIPFKGPLQSDTNLDDLPRIPYTYNPGGRKYLRTLKKTKEEEAPKEIPRESARGSVRGLVRESARGSVRESARGSEAISQLAWMEYMLTPYRLSLGQSDTNLSAAQNYEKLIRLLSETMSDTERVVSQLDEGVQCTLSKTGDALPVAPNRSSETETRLESRPFTVIEFTRARIDYCKNYLKHYENSETEIEILKEIYIIALTGMRHVTTLSVNYSLLADGTGDVLMSIGSVTQGKLKDLELLCQLEDLPSPAHQQYDKTALHAIPDVTWKSVLSYCPELKVHIVCVSMSPYDITKKFITRSIPLNSLHLDSGFCPTLTEPQITFFSTLKCLHQYFKESLQHVYIVMWHSTGRIDGSLETFIKEASQLQSFEYHGPLQLRTTINKLCDAALRPSSKIASFTLMVRGDPCFPHIARELTTRLYNKYKPKFAEQYVHFMLGAY